MPISGLVSCTVTTMTPEELSWAVAAALKCDKRKANIPDELLWMDGHTAPRQRALLNKLCHFIGRDVSYLEVGVLYGATLLAASYCNSGEFVGIDDFSQGTKDIAWRNLLSCKPALANIIEGDILTVDLTKLKKPVNVFFHDANSDIGLFEKAIDRVHPYLEDTFIWILDNWSFVDVRKRVTDYLSHLDLDIYSSVALMSVDCDINNWWNGWCIAVVQKQPRVNELSTARVPLANGVPTEATRGKGVPLHAITQRLMQGIITIKDYGI